MLFLGAAIRLQILVRFIFKWNVSTLFFYVFHSSDHADKFDTKIMNIGGLVAESWPIVMLAAAG